MTNNEAWAAKEAERQRAAAVRWAKIEKLRPPKAMALIIAEERIDESDSMRDYWGHITARKVAIGWRTGSREDFRQLRKAAAGFHETEHLGPGLDLWTLRAVFKQGDNFGNRKGDYYSSAKLHGETYKTELEALKAAVADTELPEWAAYTVKHQSVENRENWAMGGGNYLGAHRHGGWVVYSYSLQWGPGSIGMIETAFLEGVKA